jgi:hypothetical protein
VVFIFSYFCQFELVGANSGFDAPALRPWLAQALDSVSTKHFGHPCVFLGEGGSIPFMGQLAAKFPAAQFIVTGVLGMSGFGSWPSC